jgi:hypothetical protein
VRQEEEEGGLTRKEAWFFSIAFSTCSFSIFPNSLTDRPSKLETKNFLAVISSLERWMNTAVCHTEEKEMVRHSSSKCETDLDDE